MMRPFFGLAFSGLMVLSGCVVDLSRDEAVLRLQVDGTSDVAKSIVISVDDGLDMPPFVGVFALEDFARADTMGLQVLPDISVATGTVTVTAQLRDARDALLPGILAASLVIERRLFGYLLDFANAPSAEPMADERVAEARFTTTVNEPPPSAGLWEVTVPVDRTRWESAIQTLTSELGGVPAHIEVRRFKVEVVSAGGDDDDDDDGAETLDSLWAGPLTAIARGNGVDRLVGEFNIGSSVPLLNQPVESIDLSEWLITTDGNMLILSSEVSDGAETPVGFAVTLELLGRRSRD